MKPLSVLLLTAVMAFPALASEQSRYMNTAPWTSTGVVVGEYGAFYHQSLTLGKHSLRVSYRDNADYDSSDALGIQYSYVAPDWVAQGMAFKAESFDYYRVSGSKTVEVLGTHVTAFANTSLYDSDGYTSTTLGGGAYVLHNFTEDVYGTLLVSTDTLEASYIFQPSDKQRRAGGTLGYNDGKLRMDCSVFAADMYGNTGVETLTTTSYELHSIRVGVFYYTSTQAGVSPSAGISLAYYL